MGLPRRCERATATTPASICWSCTPRPNGRAICSTRGDEGPSDGPTGGFPLHDGTVTPVSQEHVRAMPVQGGLTDAQQANYSAAIIVLWIVLAVILVLMVVAIF